MTRDSVPRFDLYGELEVSPSAGVEVIEAAYRSLAKRHHPDVAGPDGTHSNDGDRIKRLNAAREWLTNAERRRRYDRVMGFGPTPRPAVRPASSVRTARSSASSRHGANRRGTDGSGERESRGGESRGGESRGGESRGGKPEITQPESEPGSFGINSERVRQFLADLRTLDEPRALQLRAGRFSVLHPDYAAARRRLLKVGRERLQAEFRLAREAAGVIARGKVADPRLAEEIATIASDIAGAIALRDILPRHDFELLLTPWTWRGSRIAAFSPPASKAPPATAKAVPAPAAPPPQAPAAAPAAAARATGLSRPQTETIRPVVPAARPRSRSTMPRGPLFGAGLALAVVAVLGGGIALVNRAPTAIADSGSLAPESTLLAGAATDVLPSGSSPTTPPSPAPTAGIDPELARELRRGAARTIRDLASAAATGSVKAAKAFLGGTAPGLQASGLAAATFPAVSAADITVIADGDGWLARAGDDTLRSTDGETWTFDYGERPLAIYAGTPEHDLFWLDPRHDLLLRVVGATVTRSEVRVRFSWTYGAGGFDAAFFDGARLWLSSLTMGTRPAEVGIEFVRLDAFEGDAVLAITGTFRGASSLTLDASVTPRTRFTNQSTFELTTR